MRTRTIAAAVFALVVAGCSASEDVSPRPSAVSVVQGDVSARVGLLNDDHREPFANTNCGDRPVIQRPNTNSAGDAMLLTGRFPQALAKVQWVFTRRANIAGVTDRMPYLPYKTHTVVGVDADNTTIDPRAFFVPGYYAVQAFGWCGDPVTGRSVPSTGGGSNVEEFGWNVEALGSSVEEPPVCEPNVYGRNTFCQSVEE